MIPVVLRLFLLTQCFTFFIGCTSNPHSVWSRPRSNLRKTWLTSFLSVTVFLNNPFVWLSNRRKKLNNILCSLLIPVIDKVLSLFHVIFVPCYIWLIRFYKKTIVGCIVSLFYTVSPLTRSCRTQFSHFKSHTRVNGYPLYGCRSFSSFRYVMNIRWEGD